MWNIFSYVHGPSVCPLSRGWMEVEAGCSGTNQAFTFFAPYLRISLLILEGKKGRERNIDVKEKQWLLASCTCPSWGLNRQPRYMPWLGIQPTIFWYMGQLSSQLTHWPGFHFLRLSTVQWVLKCFLTLLSFGGARDSRQSSPCCVHRGYRMSHAPKQDFLYRVPQIPHL